MSEVEFDFKSARVSLGYLTREAIAKEIGVTESCIKKWERGERRVPEHARRALRRIEYNQLRRKRRMKSLRLKTEAPN